MRSRPPDPKPPGTRTTTKRSLGFVSLSAVLLLAVATPSAGAATQRPCVVSSEDEDVPITWGTQAQEDEITFDLRPGTAVSLSDRYDLTVRTTGRRPYVCAGRTVAVALPTPRRDAKVIAATVNGNYIAWRTSRRGRDGTVNVGRVTKGRATAVRRARSADTPADSQVDGRILVATNGDATWVMATTKTTKNTDRAFVWPRRGRARSVTIPRDYASTFATSVAFLDDQHLVFGNSAVAKRFRPAKRGMCPKLFSGTWRTLGRLKVANGVGGGYSGERDGEIWNRILVCDPKTGTYLRVIVDPFASSGIPGCPCSSGTTTKTLGQNGPWLAIERLRETYNEPKTYLVELTDTRTGKTQTLPGALQSPGHPFPTIPPNDITNRVAWTPIVPGVTLQPGATAWLEGASDGLRVKLSDADGDRTVGQATTPQLGFDGDTLTWTDASGPQRTPVAGAAGWQPAVRATPRPRTDS